MILRINPNNPSSETPNSYLNILDTLNPLLSSRSYTLQAILLLIQKIKALLLKPNTPTKKLLSGFLHIRRSRSP